MVYFEPERPKICRFILIIGRLLLANKRSLDSVINSKTGCPYCSKGLYNHGYIKRGYNLSYPAILYLIHFTNETETFVKIGITIHNIKKRFVKKTYKAYDIVVLIEKELTLGQCIDIEQHIICELPLG